MNKIIIFIFIVAHTLYSADHSLVFVHIGDKLPGYLSDAIAQARLFNSTTPFYLIANQKAINATTSQMLQKNSVTLISCESLLPSDSHKLFLKKTKLQKGFWQRTSERFFYLEELMKKDNLTNVFHMENDNMLYVQLATLMLQCGRYKGIAAIFDNDNRCVPNFLYIKVLQPLSLLTDYFAQNADKKLTDMQIPALFKKKYGPHTIDNLPIIMPTYIKKYKLKNKERATTKRPAQYYNFFDNFQSIFDGAAIGQYLGGININSKNKMKGFINEQCLFNPSHLSYEWIADSYNRKVPYAIFNKKKYRINNLHIHSKNLKQFKS